MRHGRAKAARKTLQYFERTVGLKRKPYYSVLLDATFLTAMVRITTSNTSEGDHSESTIVSRIERVLQVNGTSGPSSFSRDGRLTTLDGSHDDNNNNNNNNAHSNNSSGHHYNNHHHYNVRFFVPQEAVDELELIVQTLKERSESTNKRKKKAEYASKSKVFEDALAWIRGNSTTPKQKRLGSWMGRCEVLPRLESRDEHDDDEAAAATAISASDAIRRHIARDDGREDNEGKEAASPPPSTITRTYIVASQEENLLDDLRMLGTVPVLRCTNNASVLILENPSKKGQRTEQQKESSKWKGGLKNEAEKALVDAAWKVQKTKSKEKLRAMLVEQQPTSSRGAVKAKGPNPLSCKRKRSGDTKSKDATITTTAVSKSKKRRLRAQRNKETQDE